MVCIWEGVSTIQQENLSLSENFLELRGSESHPVIHRFKKPVEPVNPNQKMQKQSLAWHITVKTQKAKIRRLSQVQSGKEKWQLDGQLISQLQQ